MESALTKFICGKNGSMICHELAAVFPHDNYPTESLQDVTSNQERFHLAFFDGKRTVIAKTKLRLCKAKDCGGCRNLHLCKQFLLGDCRFEKDRQKGCYFGHDIASEQNARALRDHGLEDLDRTELCTLLLQNDSYFLPSVCHSYNNGVGEHGRCGDGDDCKRLHICERYLRGPCTCSHHAHDFYEPHPMKTLLDWGMPSHMLGSIRTAYMNVEALRDAEHRGRRGNLHGKTEICPFFAKGSCKYGEKCFKTHSRYPYRQGSNERWQSNSRQGSNERWQSNSSATDFSEHEDWESFLESSVPTTLPPVDKRVYPPAAAGADTMETWLKRWQAEKEPMFQVASEMETMKAQMIALFEELQDARRKLQEGERVKTNLLDRYRDTKQIVLSQRDQLEEKQRENERLKLQLESVTAQTQPERKQREHPADCGPQLFEDHTQLKEQRTNREVSEDVVDDLRTRLASAELALVAKQQQIDAMMQEVNHTETDTVSVFQAQAEVYASDFYAERAAREQIHEEKERLSAQLEFVKKQNDRLQDELDSLGRQSLTEMRKRHSPHGGASAPLFRDGDFRIPQRTGNIPEHVCPMCDEVMPDLDSLQIHVVDCNP